MEIMMTHSVHPEVGRPAFLFSSWRKVDPWHNLPAMMHSHHPPVLCIIAPSEIQNTFMGRCDRKWLSSLGSHQHVQWGQKEALPVHSLAGPACPFFRDRHCWGWNRAHAKAHLRGTCSFGALSVHGPEFHWGDRVPVGASPIQYKAMQKNPWLPAQRR